MNKRYERDLARSRHNHIDNELRKAIDKFPQWPNNIYAALSIVGEEYGELVKDVLQYHFEPSKGKTIETIRAEGIQTLAMLHRFLNSLDTGRYTAPDTTQHEYNL
jgi:hypothetical protein